MDNEKDVLERQGKYARARCRAVCREPGTWRSRLGAFRGRRRSWQVMFLKRMEIRFQEHSCG